MVLGYLGGCVSGRESERASGCVGLGVSVSESVII